jgi:hypothetical protein
MTDNTNNGDLLSGNIEVASAAEVAQTTMDFIINAGSDYTSGMSPAAAAYAGACQAGVASAAGFLAGATAGSVPAMAGAAASAALASTAFAGLCNTIAIALADYPTVNDPAPIGVAGFTEYGAMLNNGFAGYGELNVGIDSNGNIQI